MEEHKLYKSEWELLFFFNTFQLNSKEILCLTWYFQLSPICVVLTVWYQSASLVFKIHVSAERGKKKETCNLYKSWKVNIDPIHFSRDVIKMQSKLFLVWSGSCFAPWFCACTAGVSPLWHQLVQTHTFITYIYIIHTWHPVLVNQAVLFHLERFPH